MQIAFVGCGNLGRAILSRWLAAGAVQADQVRACVAREESAAALRADLGVAASLSLAEALRGADVAILACKPQQRHAVLAGIAELGLAEGALWISLLAGVTLADLHPQLGRRLLRWMPNTPVGIGLGATAVCGEVDADGQADAQRLLDPLGQSHWMAEAQFDAFTAVAGSGPAYVFAFCEALAAAGQAAGLDADQAHAAARQTVVGAAALLAQSAKSPEQLRGEVTSKGGMTAAALAAMAERDWAGALRAGVQAGMARAAELRKT